jgi:hypothetical protein
MKISSSREYGTAARREAEAAQQFFRQSGVLFSFVAMVYLYWKSVFQCLRGLPVIGGNGFQMLAYGRRSSKK